MTKKQMMLIVGLLVLSVVSVGAHLLTRDGGSLNFANFPDPSKLPATPTEPLEPPLLNPDAPSTVSEYNENVD